MKNKILIAIACFFFLAFSFPSIEIDANHNQQNTQEWIKTKIEQTLKENNVPALSVSIMQNGKPMMITGFGVQNRESNVPVDENSIYQLGSLSKMFTGIIANNLIKQNVLKLDESIVSYLPEHLNAKAKMRLQKVKVRQLLHHSSGIRRTSKVVKRIDGDPMIGGYSEVDLIKELNMIKLKFEPDSKWQYSNLGYAILGYVCENASGKNYTSLLEEYILEPYGLKNTFINPDAKHTFPIVTPYRKDKRNVKTKAWEMGKLAAAGGIYSNITDLNKLIKAQREAYKLYEKNGTSHPLVITASTFPLNERVDYGFGLFQVIGEDYKSYGHGGDLDGYASTYKFVTNLDIEIILLTSCGGKWINQLERDIEGKLRVPFE